MLDLIWFLFDVFQFVLEEVRRLKKNRRPRKRHGRRKYK